MKNFLLLINLYILQNHENTKLRRKRALCVITLKGSLVKVLFSSVSAGWGYFLSSGGRQAKLIQYGAWRGHCG
jgi:hypothetical protein